MTQILEGYYYICKVVYILYNPLFGGDSPLLNFVAYCQISRSECFPVINALIHASFATLTLALYFSQKEMLEIMYFDFIKVSQFKANHLKFLLKISNLTFR